MAINDPILDEVVWALAVLRHHNMLDPGEVSAKVARIAVWRDVVERTVWDRLKKFKNAPAPPPPSDEAEEEDGATRLARFQLESELEQVERQLAQLKPLMDELDPAPVRELLDRRGQLKRDLARR